jgi:hypothetical protein
MYRTGLNRGTLDEVLMKASPTEVDQGSAKTEERLVIDTTPALIHTARPDGNLEQASL